MTGLELLKSIYSYYSNHPCLIIITSIMLLFFFLEFILSLRISRRLKFMVKKMEEDKLTEDKFLLNLINDYKSTVHNKDYQLINPEAYVDSFLARKKSCLLHSKEILKQSDYIFILTGLFSSFIIILFGITNLNLEGVTGLNDLFTSLSTLLFSLKPALIIMTLSIIFALLSNILLRFWNLDYRLDIFKSVLIDYLLNNIDKNNSSPEKDLFLGLIKAIEKNTVTIDESINNKLIKHLQGMEEKLSIFQLEEIKSTAGEELDENSTC
ncbi:MAG: hypothetical protein FH762_14505 [Firmicutes bacterium]|nr:hypothetical protein [Bacillota bacterium]